MHVDGPTINGNERQLLLIVDGLRKRGHEVVVSCRATGPVVEALRMIGVETTDVRPRGDADLWSTYRFARWLRRQRPDAVLLTSWKRAFGASWGARWAGVPRIVLRIGGVHRFPAGTVSAWKYRRALQHNVDALYVNSQEVAGWVREVPGVRAGSVRLIPNGIELVPAARIPLRKELGLAPGHLLIGAVGSLERIKGFDLLLDALAQVNCPAAHLAIAGEGSQRRALQERSTALGVASRVHLLGHRTDVGAVLAACDIYVLSSRSEGMAVAMLEAMAAARPVIAADVGGVRDALQAREGRAPAGWIVARENVAALSEALREVIDGRQTNRAEITARASEAQWRIRNWFTVDRMIAAVEDLLLGAEAVRESSRSRSPR